MQNKIKQTMNKQKSTLYFISLHIYIISFNLVQPQPISSRKQLCFKEESVALLTLRNSFTTDNLGVISTWNTTTDCCEWEGITCHPKTNHVSTLDLSINNIIGTIENNSTLFQLHHLETLNLAFNYFHGSLISPKFGQFSFLKHLNLTGCSFTGDIPAELGHLSKLETLDLSYNLMKMPHFQRILTNMTRIKRLDLSGNKFDSDVFPTLSNLSSLEYLALSGCGLKEELPFSILNLPLLNYLDVGINYGIYSSFGLSNWTSPLQHLDLSFVNFSSQIPALPGRAPYKLLQLIILSECNFTGEVPSWIWNTPELEGIRVANNQLNGVPSTFLRNITSTKLQYFDLRSNKFTGNISLYSIYNRFPNLMGLLLSNNDLTVTSRDDNDTILTNWPMIVDLALSSCNMVAIPDILKNQSYLHDLDLSNNHIHGDIPEWFLHEGRDSLEGLDLSNNFLTGKLENLPWGGLWYIALSSNMFQGKLPNPPTTTVWFAMANNNFTGSINSSICDLSNLWLLDLSNNSLGGEFPACLGNTSDTLRVLNLGSNRIAGSLPLNFTKCSSLEYLDLSNNRLQGPARRSLAACGKLQLVNLRSNRLKDEFPLWLHNLPQIHVLDLSFNNLYGSISHKIQNPFPTLQILDLSSNNFGGEIPVPYISSFRAMMNITQPTGGGRYYMGSGVSSIFRDGYSYSMIISISGAERKYEKIITTLTTFDLSNNNFTGEIPDSIGDLVLLHSLNISNNKITGKIPTSIGNLKMINSLDLSANKLAGNIPQELTDITSMGVFNVSDNQLTGEIPKTNNFKTFSANSFQKNLGLCGFPLPDCGKVSPDSAGRFQGSSSQKGGFLDLSVWKITAIGYGFGTALGVAWGYYWLASGNMFFLTKWSFLLENKAARISKKFTDRRRRRSGGLNIR